MNRHTAQTLRCKTKLTYLSHSEDKVCPCSPFFSFSFSVLFSPFLSDFLSLLSHFDYTILLFVVKVTVSDYTIFSPKVCVPKQSACPVSTLLPVILIVRSHIKFMRRKVCLCCHFETAIGTQKSPPFHIAAQIVLLCFKFVYGRASLLPLVNITDVTEP